MARFYKVTPARRIAFETLLEFYTHGGVARDILDNILRERNIIQKERGFAQVLVMGVVSTSGSLKQILSKFTNVRKLDKEVLIVLMLSTFELYYLEKSSYAVVDQGVRLMKLVNKKASGLANAVLRNVSKLAATKPRNPKTHEELSLLYGFPLELTELLIHSIGLSKTKELMKAQLEAPPLFVSASICKSNALESFELLESLRVSYQTTKVSNVALVSDVPKLLQSGVLKEEKMLASDISAQYIAQLVAHFTSKSLIEVGFGQATKTLLLDSMFRRKLACGNLQKLPKHIGIEYDKTRYQEAQRRTVHLLSCNPASNIKLIQKDFLELDPTTFSKAQVVFIDAPCTGTGTMRKHPELVWNINSNKLTELSTLQLKLICHAAQFVEPGGYLIYSTCSVLHDENEGVVNAFLASETGGQFKVVVDEKRGLNPMFQSYPASNEGDGHFCAVLQCRI